MDEEPKKLTPFEEFAARRIAEFPTLYHCQEDVICGCILNSRGDCRWENGVMVLSDQHYDKTTKTFTQYPLRMSIEVAASLHQYKAPNVSWDMGSARAPIHNMPKDVDKSYLQAIDIFLFTWEKLKKEDWEILAKAYCLRVYHMQENINANEPSRKLKDYLMFMDFIPKWRAIIREIEYFQQHGEIDPRTFQGENI